MAERPRSKKEKQADERFSDEEQSAMRERAQELKTAGKRRSRSSKADGENDVLAKIAEMTEPDRSMAERLHHLIKRSAPDLSPKTWYGMPAYARDGDVICFFQGALKFKTRYASLGFSDKATLDEGDMWPTAYALQDLGSDEEERIAALVKKATS